MKYGPPTIPADKLHAEKYRGKGESFEEAMNRVASTLAPRDAYKPFREILLDMRFLPGGRIQTAVGSPRQTTPHNCYVSGPIDDSLTSGTGSIMERLKEAARTMQMGGGIGYNFGTLRPRGDTIRKLQSRSSGSVSWMNPFNSVGLAISSAGHRRGAQMGVMPVDHPDIYEFVRAKQDETSLTGFNISVGVTDKFMKAVEEGREFELQWNGQVYETIQARDLWEVIMRSTWDWAEPGVLFIDRINGHNNLRYCEEITATNPCGEQPLPPFGACLLGSFNMTKCLTWHEDGDHGSGWRVDLDKLERDVAPVVAAMDRVIDIGNYPLDMQKREAESKRRMGLGVTGMANTIELCGHRYGSEAYLIEQDRILGTLANAAYAASARLAAERGSFPLFDRDEYAKSPFIRSLDADTQELIQKYGLRNSHLVSIAPTGTISMTAGNVSSGIEPVYLHESQRTVQGFDGPEIVQIKDWAYEQYGFECTLAEHVPARDHVRVLARAQRWVDSAVSKTCNVSPDMPWEDFKELYMDAWRWGAKGCTTFNPGGKRFGIMQPVEGAACSIDENGKTNCE